MLHAIQRLVERSIEQFAVDSIAIIPVSEAEGTEDASDHHTSGGRPLPL